MSKFIVCPACEGEGSTVHPALSVWTESDRFDDPEGFEHMLEGRYDVACPMCKGLRVVTPEREEEYADERADYHVRLAESGIYPGHPDYD